jgi:processive 1,2-diacylglycerol beta-glucosyltransferase
MNRAAGVLTSPSSTDASPPQTVTVAPAEVVSSLAGLGVPLAGARVLVVSGSFGAGHDSAAAQIVERLRDAGSLTRTLDVVDFFPTGTGRLVRWAYLRLLCWWPAGWALLLSRLTPGRQAHAAVTATVGRLGGRLLHAVGSADLVVSTHPFASQALGRERVAGRLRAPLVTYLTDPSVHALWVHPGVDLHLALHAAAVVQARRLLTTSERPPEATGALTASRRSQVTLVKALVPAAYEVGLAPQRRAHLRRTLGVPAGMPLVLVVGGSLGVGSLRQSACDLRDVGGGTPVVVCGHNRRLRSRLRQEAGVVAVGWRTDLPDLIRAADCVLQNAGGFTAWETLAAGTAVISYRPVRGHGETNAAALASDGLVPWPRTPTELRTAVATAVSTASTVLPAAS